MSNKTTAQNMDKWKTGVLKEIAEVIMGQSPAGESCNTNGVGIPLLNGPTEFGNKNPVPIQFTKDAKKISRKDDILFCVRGSTTGRMNWSDQEYAIGRGLAAMRHRLGSEYKYFVRGILDFNLGGLLMSATGSTFPNVSKDQLEELEILIPSLEEQKSIASILSSLDNKIDLLHRQNATLEAMAETLFRQWFVEEAKEDDLVPLSEFSVNIRQNARVDELNKHTHYVGLEHIPRKSISLTTCGDTVGLASNKSIFVEDDILFGKLRSYFHKVVFAPWPGVCSTDILVIRAKKRDWFPFCLFWFSNKDVVEYSDLGSGGTRMPRTNWKVLSSYKVPRPDSLKMEEFSIIVGAQIGKIKSNLSQIQTLTTLRDILLPKLMSGEVRVGE